ncbi:MAG: site-2 protease family protein [Terracidiphilus sp.]|nr:site-2 protease family protein [Terracidiphilus sp.]MDR3775375.1 site-2 protease family protein [Terracidiphilus sp.]
MQPSSFIIAVFEFVLLIFSLSVHECAHAWMASRLGDQTARLQGRVTLNPMYHVDPIGTLLFPALMIFGPLMGGGAMGGFLIGWAKPTPVITRNFRKIVRDDALVTLAGPVSNLLLAFAGFVGMACIIVSQGRLPETESMATNVQALGLLCQLAIQVNLALFFFNLLPIPPLDGSRILRNMLPYNAVQAYDRLSGWMGLLVMILVGGPVVRFFMVPTLHLVYAALALI